MASLVTLTHLRTCAPDLALAVEQRCADPQDSADVPEPESPKSIAGRWKKGRGQGPRLRAALDPLVLT